MTRNAQDNGLVEVGGRNYAIDLGIDMMNFDLQDKNNKKVTIPNNIQDIQLAIGSGAKIVNVEIYGGDKTIVLESRYACMYLEELIYNIDRESDDIKCCEPKCRQNKRLDEIDDNADLYFSPQDRVIRHNEFMGFRNCFLEEKNNRQGTLLAIISAASSIVFASLTILFAIKGKDWFADNAKAQIAVPIAFGVIAVALAVLLVVNICHGRKGIANQGEKPSTVAENATNAQQGEDRGNTL